ncbi:uncharacterized protein N0V89_002673 [Didymosphaeria variabile]|uniref:G-patch domain-containing protein n=1 Tax=Didymosphaeria variabile TaxID=1932322 RepID=A0A9W8XT52_9PLEO|nr:uncharacterized protein N0V89_002673 [Didymosphaeria variabile]KAJ4358094.1 hypothetical protein N0V89_002673 [Didymosphaeria variabile]
MNAEGLLRRQGWRGAGFSLDTSDRGIKKPLLISHKQDQLGLGKKKASHTTDDQWWMRAFDESLQNLGTGQTSTLSQIQEKGINRGGLYGFFVKGEGLIGTIGDESSTPTSRTSTPPTTAKGDDSTDESDSDSESTSSNDAASDAAKITKSKKGQNKRKCEAEDDLLVTKKLKQETDGRKVNARAVAKAEGEVRTAFGTINADDWPKLCALTSRISKQIKARAKNDEKAGAYGDAANVEDPKNPGKKLAKKAAKVEHQKVIRAAKKRMVKESVVEAIVKGELPMLNSENWSREEILKNYGEIKKVIKAVENANKMSNKAQRQTRRGQRREAKAKRARGKIREKTDALRQSTFDTHLAQLSPEKQIDYAARAAEKGQTLEEYTLRRMEKKEAKRLEKKPDKQDKKIALVESKGEPHNIAPWRTQKKAQRKVDQEQKDKSTKLAGKLETKHKVSQKAKAKNAEKTEGTNEEGPGYGE